MSLRLTVSGLPGSGTTTLCRLLRTRTGLRYVYAGGIFRDEAARRGLDLASFGALCEEDPAVDRALDDQQVEVLREGDVVVEGRLAGWLAHLQRIEALKVWLACDEDERVRRLVEREGGTAAQQRAATREREASERKRYASYYGIDLRSMEPYDLVLESTRRSPEALAEEVLAALRPRTL